MARANEVMAKRVATAPVIFPRMVGVPIEPNTAWVPAPPKAEPMSAPFPACRSTMPMMTKHTAMCTTISERIHHCPLAAAPALAAFLTMATNVCAFKLAPPTRTPSISGSAASASVLSALTLPP